MARSRRSSSATVEKPSKGEGVDRAPSEVFSGPAHALNLGVNQSAFVNDLKKRELEDAFGDRYVFLKIEHHGTLSPIEGDHEIAWEVRNTSDAVEDVPNPLPGKDDEGESIVDGLPRSSDDQQMSGEAEEGLKDGKTGVTKQDTPDKG